MTEPHESYEAKRLALLDLEKRERDATHAIRLAQLANAKRERWIRDPVKIGNNYIVPSAVTLIVASGPESCIVHGANLHMANVAASADMVARAITYRDESAVPA